MKRWIRCFFAIGCVLLSAIPATRASAAPAPVVELAISVTDEAGAPISGAMIVDAADANHDVLGTTDRSGRAQIRAYVGEKLVARLGDQRSAPIAADVSGAHFVIARRVIASVRTKSVDAAGRGIDANALLSVIAGNPSDALALLPQYRSSEEGGTGDQELNGTPLLLPSLPSAQGGGSSASIPSSLISSFNPTSADDGSVEPNYHLASPTTQTAATAQASASSYDGLGWKSMLSGRRGRLGYAFTAAGGADGGVLVGQDVLDSSGVRYDHSTNASHREASEYLSYTLPQLEVDLVGLGSTSGGNHIVDESPGGLLQGVGPGNTVRNRLGNAYLMVTHQAGRDSVSALDVRFNGSGTVDDTFALTGGISTPSVTGYTYSGSFDRFGVTRSYDGAALGAEVDVTHVLSGGFGGGASVTVGSRVSDMAMSYDRTTGDTRTSLKVTGVSIDDDHGHTSMLHARASIARVTDTSTSSLALYTSPAQVLQSDYVGAIVLTPAQAATFDCSTGVATVSAPASVNGERPWIRTLSASLSHKYDALTLTAGGFLSDTRNALVNPLIAYQSFVSVPYQNALGNAYTQACGGAVFDPTRIFANRFENVNDLVGREWYAQAERRFGNIVTSLSYETFADVPYGVPPVAQQTSLIAGRQLSGIPLHRAMLMLGYAHANGLAGGFALRYLSANNGDRLPGHVMVDGGARLPLGAYALSLSARNLFGALQAGGVASPTYAVPVDSTTTPIGLLATPLARTWTITISTRLSPRSE